jgi:hypothetical protein
MSFTARNEGPPSQAMTFFYLPFARQAVVIGLHVWHLELTSGEAREADEVGSLVH